MKCENYFCVYYFDGCCSIDEVSLDIGGRCQECIYLEPPQNQLEICREKLLVKLEKNDTN